jgi:hypothetical protein
MGVLCEFFDTWNIPAHLIAIISLFFIYKRLKNQERQIDLQINQRVDGRFNSAIEGGLNFI